MVAIGGNAILPAGSRGGAEEQRARVEETCGHLGAMLEEGYRITITHGNGPQVGNLLLQNEAAQATVPPMPLDVLVAESQAQIGYMIQQALENELLRRGLRGSVTCLITQVEVDPLDPAFENPTKPVGPYYDGARARELMARGWRMVEDRARGGYRRVVPSPEPRAIVEREAILRLLSNGGRRDVVIAAGGGGIPVVRTPRGLRGVEAVVDKDLASGVLATAIGAELLILLTDVPQVALDFGKPTQQGLARLGIAEALAHLGEGQFPPGSMGPKVRAAVEFLRRGGRRAIITDPPTLADALRGKGGTTLER